MQSIEKLSLIHIFTEEKQFQQGEIAIADGVFAKEADGEVIDGEGCYAIPGMVDVHFHGCVAVSYTHLDVYKRQLIL